MTFHPAPAGTGIIFRRVDLPNTPHVPARLENVVDTARCTTIGKDGVHVKTVEHVLAALAVNRIDNLYIDLSAEEPPVMDGSSLPFVALLEEAGIAEQKKTTHPLILEQPLYWSEGEIHLVALPSPEWRVSYTLSYPKSSLLDSQYYSFLVTPEGFKDEIASARTFALYEELSYLIDKGFIKGGSLSNAVVIKGDAILTVGGLRYPNEMVRHKILDLIGDLYLLGHEVQAHLIAIRTGHRTNSLFAKHILHHINEGLVEG